MQDSTNTKDYTSSFITQNLSKLVDLAFYKAGPHFPIKRDEQAILNNLVVCPSYCILVLGVYILQHCLTRDLKSD